MFGKEMEHGRRDRVGDRFTAHAPRPRARQVATEQILDQLSRGGIGQGLSLVRPFLQLDESPGFRARRIETTEIGELAYCPRRVDRPERRLEHLHRQRAKRRRSGFAVPPQDRKSTRLNSSHPSISYAVFCLKKKK